MNLIKPNPTQALAGLRAMKTLLAQGKPFAPPQHALLEAIQRNLLGTAHDLDALEPISPEALAEAVGAPPLRTQLVNAMVTLSLAGHEVEPAQSELVGRFAAALEVEPISVRQLRELAERRLLLFRLDVARSGVTGMNIRTLFEESGVLGGLKGLAAFAGVIENPEVAAKYHALEGKPDGTLGKELWRFYRKHGYAFPGEKHGAPEGLLTHDLSHILGGYETDPRGEAEVLSFQAGYSRENPFGILIFLLAQAQQGLRVTKLAEPARWSFDDLSLVEATTRAFFRGAAMKIDLLSGWDYLADFDTPVAELRARYGIEG